MEEAVRIWEASRANNPDLLPVLFSLASHYEGSGRHAEAQAVVADIRSVNPELRADDIGSKCSVGGSPGDVATQREKLRHAGLP